MNPHDLESIRILQNNAPIADFEGLSANEMHQLVYGSLYESPIALKIVPDAVLDQVMLFRIAEALINIVIRENYIKLTPLGALPKKPIVEIYELGYVKESDIESRLVKLWKEADSISISLCRVALEAAHILKKQKGRLSLTAKAKKIINGGNRNELFKMFLHAFMSLVNWGYVDGFPEVPVGQIAWRYTVFLLLKFGHESHAENFYAKKYKTAFPALIKSFPTNSYRSADELFETCYSLRTFERCMKWMGWIEVVEDAGFLEYSKSLIKRKPLLTELFGSK